MIQLPNLLTSLTVVLSSLEFNSVSSFLVLDAAIQQFIAIVLITGPIFLVAIVLILKIIEKYDPDRIRWK